MLASSRPRIVKCVETGEIFPSVHAAARAYKITGTNLARILNHHLIDHTLAGYHWEALSPTIRVFYQLVPYEGEVVNFSSITGIMAYLDVTEGQVHYALRKGIRIEGYRVIRCEEIEEFGENQQRVGHKFI